jgi:antitoxin HicB
MRTYTVVLTPDYESGGFTVTVPALPGCITDGETIDEALERAQEAISLYLRGEDEDRFIEPSNGPRVVVAQVSVN